MIVIVGEKRMEFRGSWGRAGATSQRRLSGRTIVRLVVVVGEQLTGRGEGDLPEA
jgi:hypothetical protein